MKALLSILSLIALGTAAPHTRDDASTCQYYDGINTPKYRLQNWVEENYLPETAEQCVGLDGYDDYSVSYHANFSYSPTAGWLLGYPNVGLKEWERRSLEDHVSIPTSWEWSMNKGNALKANVNYYLSGSGLGCPSTPSWAMSIWLGSFGDLAASDGAGKAGLLIGTTNMARVAFDVYRISDPIGFPVVMWVFQAQENQESFEGDILDFLNWTVENDNGNIGCVWQLQAGADIYGGTGATFTTSRFSGKQILASA